MADLISVEALPTEVSRGPARVLHARAVAFAAQPCTGQITAKITALARRRTCPGSNSGDKRAIRYTPVASDGASLWLSPGALRDHLPHRCGRNGRSIAHTTQHFTVTSPSKFCPRSSPVILSVFAVSGWRHKPQPR